MVIRLEGGILRSVPCPNAIVPQCRSVYLWLIIFFRILLQRLVINLFGSVKKPSVF